MISDRIHRARTWISECEMELELARERMKEQREILRNAQRALYRAIDDEHNGVQDLPLSEPEPNDNGESVPDSVSLTGEQIGTLGKLKGKRSKAKA